MDNPFLQIDGIQDQNIRRNFENLKAYFSEQNQLLDFKFFEQVFSEAQSGVKIAHGLDYIPLDILVTHITGAGIVTFKYGQFDSSSIILDVSDACRIRFFVGTYSKFTSTVQNAATDSQAVSST